MPTNVLSEAHPAFLVGVAQDDLFWKDIRRVLFSQARYTVFCRLASESLIESWSPVKMADVFSGTTADFDEMIRGLGGELMSGFKKGVRSATAGTRDDAILTISNYHAELGERILTKYIESIAIYHKVDIHRTVIETLISGSSLPENWLDSVDSYRPVFADMTKKVDELLEVDTPPGVAHDLRVQVVRGSSLDQSHEPGDSTDSGNGGVPRCERFLDSEIVAIYW